MKKDNLYIYEKRALTSLIDTTFIVCGLYASCGINGGKRGDLYAVASGPVLMPVYDKNGKRKNVGRELSGMSYDFRRGEWYIE